MNDDLYLTADESREWVLDLYRTAWAHAAVTFEECDLETVGPGAVVGRPAAR